MTTPPPHSIALAGLGAIGMAVARALDAGRIPGLTLAAVAAGDPARAAERVKGFRSPPAVVPTAELARHAAIVVDAAPSGSFRGLAESALDAGRLLVTVNAGALLSHLDLVERAKATGGRILVPTGALLGLDAVRAAAEGTIRSVTMTTRKPPGGLKGAPYLVEKGIDVDALTEPTCIFRGTAGEGAKGFPANVNVAAALSLAGIGPERTTLEIWAEPGSTRNIHHIAVEADEARFTLQIEGVPSIENPRTGKLTPLSVIACLRGLVQPLKVGT